MSGTDTIDFEREFEELVRELRALPTAAPEDVRHRVRALDEPAPRRRLPTLPWRRSLLVLAPVCALGLVLAAVVHGVLNSAPKQQNTMRSIEPASARAASTVRSAMRAARSGGKP